MLSKPVNPVSCWHIKSNGTGFEIFMKQEVERMHNPSSRKIVFKCKPKIYLSDETLKVRGAELFGN